jgi:hypothetical protein
MDPGKKRVEEYMLSAARDAGVPIPAGEKPGEEPDFRFPALGIETSEVLRPASSNFGIVPVEKNHFTGPSCGARNIRITLTQMPGMFM